MGISPEAREIDGIPGGPPCAPLGHRPGSGGPACEPRGATGRGEMSQPWPRAAEIRHPHKQGHKGCSHGCASCAPSPQRALYGLLSALRPTTAQPGGIFASIKQIRRQGSKRRGGGQGHEGYNVAVPGPTQAHLDRSPPRSARVISRPRVLKHKFWKAELLPGKEQGWTHLTSSP